MHFKHQRILAVVAAAGLALAGGAQAQSGPDSHGVGARDTRQGRPVSQDRQFMHDAAQSGLAEVQASEQALKTSSDPQVRQFAERMVTDHQRVDQELQRLATRKGIDLPAAPSFLQQERLQILRMPGAGFRQEYVDGFGVDAHQAAVSIYQNEVETGKDVDVVAFARQVLPTLKQHLEMARILQRDQDAGAGTQPRDQVASAGSATGLDRHDARHSDPGEVRQTQEEIDEAVQVVHRMKSDPEVRDALSHAKGVFILPDYGRAALGVGVQGGRGILVTREGGRISNPVFYTLGGVSIGAQAGGSGGAVAMLLMTDKAVQEFRSGKHFSLNADAGLTLADWSRRAEASGGKVQDVVVWSGTRGAYVGASLATTDIWYDTRANQAYYGRVGLDPSRILNGSVGAPTDNVLGMVLAV